MSKRISIIVPCFNEQENLAPICQDILSQFTDGYTPELIMINDGSTDDSLQQMIELSKESKHIKYLSFSRNFGHQSAIKAGLDYATGECAIMLDGDMQHPPSLIPSMITKWESGADIVQMIRSTKNTSAGKKASSSSFYKIINALSDIKVEEGSADYRLFDRKVIEVAKDFKERDLFWRGLTVWMGFKTSNISFDPANRLHGQTKYPFRKMLRFAISGITSFSVKPLRLSIYIGLSLAFMSLIYASYAIGMYVFTDKAVQGWTSILVSILFIGGLQLFILGVIGEYLGKLFMQSKQRPSYIIQESNFN